MGAETTNVNVSDLKHLIQDVALIKDYIFCHKGRPDPEGELSDWAKKELEKARKTPDSELISMEDIEKEFL